ncbi:MAG: 2-hydroxyacyl-CoA dehydratase [Dehalococcoidales bacterium]|nr:2-hydroxyacyl-CoA dehydratase [Dehalococcoidales bacterium]
MQETNLVTHMQNRPEQLKEAKENGIKLVGYFPGNYVPEELIYASGAIPVCLIHGGNFQVADSALSVVSDVICPFARAQLGEMMSGENPYYSMIDMLIAPITCQHLKKVAEIWEYNGDLEIFKLGIPHQYDGEFELDYYTNRLRVLAERLQSLTGNEITNTRISNSIELYNRMRELLKKLSLSRRAAQSPINGTDLIKLNHASYYADPDFMVEVLESVFSKLEENKSGNTADAPRLLLLGPNVAYGDYQVLELVEKAGGNIVIEDICEGIRYYWQEIENKGDLIQSLAKGYLRDRLPCAFMKNSAKKRLDFALELVREFNVAGVIWYELLCCETYDAESYYFTRKMEEHDIPMLILETDYSKGSSGQFTTRIEAFIEVVKGRAMSND